MLNMIYFLYEKRKKIVKNIDISINLVYNIGKRRGILSNDEN